MRHYYDVQVCALRVHLRRDIADIACAIIEEKELIEKLRKSPHRDCDGACELGHCCAEHEHDNWIECHEYSDRLASLHPMDMTLCGRDKTMTDGRTDRIGNL